MQRTIMDFKRITPYAGETFYEINPKNKNEYRTVYMRIQPTLKDFIIAPSYANYVVGVPPDGMEELNPRLVSAIMRSRHLSMSPF